MAMARRIFLFLAVNVLVVMTITTILSLLGVRPYLTAYGLDYGQLAVFCLIWGMGGAFISLLMSRAIAKWSMGVQLIDSTTPDPAARELYSIVSDLARKANLSMPEVGIYPADELNAFATGPSKNRALVAVSSGLLTRMRRGEIEGVLGHEISHVANGDMVTMTLLQGVVNAFVMFLAKVIAYAVTIGRDEENRGGTLVYYLVDWVLQVVFMLFGSLIVSWFSRYREYRADAGGAQLASRDKMVAALEALRRNQELQYAGNSPVSTLQISAKPSGIMALFSSHPPLEDRIEKLMQNKKLDSGLVAYR